MRPAALAIASHALASLTVAAASVALAPRTLATAAHALAAHSSLVDDVAGDQRLHHWGLCGLSRCCIFHDGSVNTCRRSKLDHLGRGDRALKLRRTAGDGRARHRRERRGRTHTGGGEHRRAKHGSR